MQAAVSRYFQLLILAALIACTSVTSGCKPSDGSEAVHGKVTFQGQPLSNASITFFPTTGRSVAAPLVAGEYAVQLMPGDYVAAVAVGNELPSGWKEGDPVPPPKVVLPPVYTERTKSTLKASIKSGQNEPVNFDLK